MLVGIRHCASALHVHLAALLYSYSFDTGCSLRWPSICARDQAAVTVQSSSAVTPPAAAYEELTPAPDYTTMGPFQAQKLPKLEHTCSQCFPACQTNKCLLRTEVWYPKGGTALGLAPPYPLAIFSSGFMVASEAYQSYAHVLASWGYTVILYDKTESAIDAIDDELSARFISVRISI